MICLHQTNVWTKIVPAISTSPIFFEKIVFRDLTSRFLSISGTNTNTFVTVVALFFAGEP